MKNNIHVLLAVLSLGLGWTLSKGAKAFDDDEGLNLIDVLTTTGPAKVTHDEFLKAHQRFLTAKNEINIEFENENGSISIRNPRYRFGGELMPFATWHTMSTKTYEAHKKGICKHFKLGKPIFVRNKGTAGIVDKVILDKDGDFHKMGDPSFAINIGTITCEKSREL